MQAKLCQQTIEAADRSMFRYLSFLAAIHAAAFTAVSSDAVGLSAFLSEINDTSPPHEAIVLLLPALAIFMAVLCYLAGRGLSDAARQHAATVRHSEEFNEELRSFFVDVHRRRSETSSFLDRLRNGIFGRHRRAGAGATLVGVLWSAFFLGLLFGFPGPLSTDPGPIFEWEWMVAPTLLGVGMVLVGVLLLAQMLLAGS